MMIFPRSFRSRLSLFLGSGSLVCGLALHQPVQAYPQPRIPYQRVPTPPPALPLRSAPHHSDYLYSERDQEVDLANRAWLQAETARRCNIGRLIGGLVGGGIGLAASRGEGRAWAIPLGALLGSQMGCNAAADRAPLPW